MFYIFLENLDIKIRDGSSKKPPDDLEKFKQKAFLFIDSDRNFILEKDWIAGDSTEFSSQRLYCVACHFARRTKEELKFISLSRGSCWARYSVDCYKSLTKLSFDYLISSEISFV